ncbi:MULTISPECIES: hypothetical protein [unclassified Photobacterium]|uniref:hypothetical protein n=1 Tax=unclassified Photobacterium TaxID=2628852 RepID=UPI000D17986A|nr:MULTISPECIES: hypothetical protein [unclassified Photobacterium]PSV35378.1 hypothetical protein C9J44_12950 [Photobacterium sp. GB-27]PSV36291.1 hypothetical protein C9J38_13800 [Photobacterium sp. GB-210]PSV42129.1 hypothetical protein C9J46_15050 [Photobacterium sp. GB-36]PSV50789.1 hypothetical protein C9J45_18360 [Photobacterium sp. GB-1]PSW74603.1 hypothetical protein C9J41_06980 [Photobacterium sp. GB-50]
MFKRSTSLVALTFSVFSISNAFADTTQHNTYQAVPSKNELITQTDFGNQTYVFHFSSGSHQLARIDFIDHMPTNQSVCKSWKYVSALSNYNVAKQTLLRVSTSFDPSNNTCTAYAYASNNGAQMSQVLDLFQTKNYVDIAGFNLSADGFTAAVNAL